MVTQAELKAVMHNIDKGIASLEGMAMGLTASGIDLPVSNPLSKAIDLLGSVRQVISRMDDDLRHAEKENRG